MSDGLTLEKMKIDERLRSVESHMAEAQEARKNIIGKLETLNVSVVKLEKTVFGNGEKGVVHKLDELVELANQVRSVLKRIFWIISSAILIAVLPNIVHFIDKSFISHVVKQ